MNYRIILTFLKITLFTSLISAQTPEIKNLVFEGAGMRGLAYCGALTVLEDEGLMTDIERVGGTSAGAITALLFSLGYTAEEMETLISTTKFKKFNDGKFWIFGGIFRMKNKYGWYRSRRFSDFIGALIEQKAGSSDITFEELHRQGYKDLYVTATCLNRQEVVVFSRETYPKMKIKDAVRVSMSIPLYFQALFVDDEGSIYEKQREDNSLDIMADGGIIGNFPIHLFDTTAVDSTGKEYRIPNPHTLGIRMDSDAQITADQNEQNLAHLEINNLKDYINAFYTIVIEKLNRNELTQADWDRTVSISHKGIAPKVRKLKKVQKDLLIDSGKAAMEAFCTH